MGRQAKTSAAASRMTRSIFLLKRSRKKADAPSSCRLMEYPVISALKGAIQTLKSLGSSFFTRFSRIFCHCSAMGEIYPFLPSQANGVFGPFASIRAESGSALPVFTNILILCDFF